MKQLTALQQRILTSILLIPIILLFIFFSPNFLFALGTGVICLIAAWEWTRLMQLQRAKDRIIFLAQLALSMIVTYVLQWWTLPLTLQLTYFIFISMVWLSFLILIIQYNRKPIKAFNGFIYGFIGLLICYAFWFGLLIIRFATEQGDYLILTLLVLIWIADTSAYFVGKRYGKNKLVPQVSPGKTREGLYGELAISLCVILLIAYFFQALALPFFIMIIFSILSVITSIIGDLFISVLKRQRNLKDTGQLLPGHGGLLDRIDSLIAATPIFTVGILLLRML